MLCAVFIGLTSLIASSIGLETGAPSAACDSMTPNHLGLEPEPVHECPFGLTQTHVIYGNSTEAISVTLGASADPGKSFRGFLVEAFNPLNGKRIGKFTATSSAVQSMDKCHAATHTSRSEKKSITLLWKPEDVHEEHPVVVFKATFVESFAIFYVGVDSTIDGVPAVKKIEDAMNASDSEPDAESSENAESED